MLSFPAILSIALAAFDYLRDKITSSFFSKEIFSLGKTSIVIITTPNKKNKRATMRLFFIRRNYPFIFFLSKISSPSAFEDDPFLFLLACQQRYILLLEALKRLTMHFQYKILLLLLDQLFLP